MNDQRRADFARARATNDRLAKEAAELLARPDMEEGPNAETLRDCLRKIEDWNRRLDEADPSKWN